MFKARVVVWMDSAADHVKQYMTQMLEDGKEDVPAFQAEYDALDQKMNECNPKYTVNFMYMWSVRDYIAECLRFCSKET